MQALALKKTDFFHRCLIIFQKTGICLMFEREKIGF